jgi:hypothetical protein
MSTGSSVVADLETHPAGKRAAQTSTNTHTAIAELPALILPARFIDTVIKKCQSAYV